jgi:hypothetical protein
MSHLFSITGYRVAIAALSFQESLICTPLPGVFSHDLTKTPQLEHGGSIIIVLQSYRMRFSAPQVGQTFTLVTLT